MKDLGIDENEWVEDNVCADGVVFDTCEEVHVPARNYANLSFAYQDQDKPLEIEMLEYTSGDNWVEDVRDGTSYDAVVSHVGMHVTEEELERFRAVFRSHDIPVVQEVLTREHQNPAIAGKRWYHYVIFGTRDYLGFDSKFIVRRNEAPSQKEIDTLQTGR